MRLSLVWILLVLFLVVTALSQAGIAWGPALGTASSSIVETR